MVLMAVPAIGSEDRPLLEELVELVGDLEKGVERSMPVDTIVSSRGIMVGEARRWKQKLAMQIGLAVHHYRGLLPNILGLRR